MFRLEDVASIFEELCEGGDLWRGVLVGVARADDELFKAIASRHGTYVPGEVVPGARSVVVVFLAFSERVVESNVSGVWASREWAIAYVEANRLLEEGSRRLVGELEARGYRSAAIPPTGGFDPDTLRSPWSHRHAAYIAGLGSLGVHGLLITRMGCCGRLVTVVTQAPLEPTPRLKGELCLERRGSPCLRCVERCPFNALTPRGLDKRRCYEACRENARLHRGLGEALEVCGKCMCGVPCSLRAPMS